MAEHNETPKEERARLMQDYEQKLRACASIHECRVIANRIAVLDFMIEKELSEK